MMDNQSNAVEGTCEWMYSSPPLAFTKCTCQGPGYDLNTLQSETQGLTFHTRHNVKPCMQ